MASVLSNGRRRPLRVLSVVGGRPHLIKSESIHAALAGSAVDHQILRAAISALSDYPSDDDFALPRPRAVMHCEEPASLTIALADEFARIRPEVLLLYGDLAVTGAALSAARATGTPVIHVEAGYRSGDSTDPEEETRVLADRIARAHLAYSPEMVANLLAEGVDKSSIFRVPDPARLSLHRHALRACLPTTLPSAQGLVTFHHDETFESPGRLEHLVDELGRVARRRPLHVILYRRTAKELGDAGLLTGLTNMPGITASETLPYEAFLAALGSAAFVITDSSGVQDDCVTLGKPCLVSRRASPRPLVPPLSMLPDIDGNAWDLSAAVREALLRPTPPPATPLELDRLADGLQAAIRRATGADATLRETVPIEEGSALQPAFSGI